MSLRKLVLVGECPNSESIVDRPSLALTGDTGRRLCAIAGWEWLDYLRHTERLNLFYEPKYAWPRNAARDRAVEMRPLFASRRVVLLGQKVAEAFGKAACPNYEWKTYPDNSAIALVPHPSGRNRLWNAKAERDRAHEFLKDLLDA